MLVCGEKGQIRIKALKAPMFLSGKPHFLQKSVFSFQEDDRSLRDTDRKWQLRRQSISSFIPGLLCSRTIGLAFRTPGHAWIA